MERFISEVIAFRLDDSWWKLSNKGRAAVKAGLARLLSGALRSGFIKAKAYASMKPESDIIFWLMASSPSKVIEAKLAIEESLSGYASFRQGFLSTYFMSREMDASKGGKFFVAYPMSKEPGWYLKPESSRRSIVAEHVKIATRSEFNDGIASYTTEAFGIGDSEFVVIYELKDIWNWVRVTEQLRHATARKWITNETPILVGLEGLDSL